MIMRDLIPTHDWEPLPACSSAPSEHARFVLPEPLLQHTKHQLIIHHRIRIMHFVRIRVIMPRDVQMRDALSEVGLEGVDAEIEKRLEFAGIPSTRRWVREVHDSETWLPQIPALGRGSKEQATKTNPNLMNVPIQHHWDV